MKRGGHNGVETSGRTCRVNAPQIRANPSRGATSATSIAAVQAVRTTWDRRRAVHRKTLYSTDVYKQPSVTGGLVDLSDYNEACLSTKPFM